MAQLTAAQPRAYEPQEDPMLDDIPTASGTNGTIYEGAAVALGGTNAANMVGLVSGSGSNDTFAGFCYRNVDNTGNGSAILNVKIRTKGVVLLSVATANGQSNVGSTVYASDGNTFSLSSTGGCSIGKVHRWITSTYCMVYFEGASARSL